MSVKLKEVVLKKGINESIMSSVLDPIESILIFNSSLSEIEELVFDHLLELEVEYPEYSDFKYISRKNDAGLFCFELVGIKKEDSTIRNADAMWQSKDGSYKKIADMDLPYLTNCINYCNKRINENPLGSQRWKDSLILLEKELEFREKPKDNEPCF